MYTKEEIQAELDRQEWKKPDLFWQNRKTADGNYLLFRGHGVIDATSVSNHYKNKDEDVAHLIHATPIFKHASSTFKFKLSLNYQNFPQNIAFVSVYAGGDNKFYPDETLEDVVAGKREDKGEKIDSIVDFDENKHFETSLNEGNRKISTYLYKFSGISKESVLITKLDETSKLMKMLEANKKEKDKGMFHSMMQTKQNSL